MKIRWLDDIPENSTQHVELLHTCHSYPHPFCNTISKQEKKRNKSTLGQRKKNYTQPNYFLQGALIYENQTSPCEVWLPLNYITQRYMKAKNL